MQKNQIGYILPPSGSIYTKHRLKMKLFTIFTVVCALGLAGVRGDTVSCSQIDYLYYDSDCCDPSNSVACMESITQADKTAIDRLASLKRADEAACEEGDAIHFSAGGIVCAQAAAGAAAEGDGGAAEAATTTPAAVAAIDAGASCTPSDTCAVGNQCLIDDDAQGSDCQDTALNAGQTCSCQTPPAATGCSIHDGNNEGCLGADGCDWVLGANMCTTAAAGGQDGPADPCADAGGVKMSENLCVELVADNIVTTTQIMDAGKDLSDAECQAVVDYYAAKCDNTAGACGFDLNPYGIAEIGMNGIHDPNPGDGSFFPICYINTYTAEHHDNWVYKANPTGNENTCGTNTYGICLRKINL